MTHRLHCQDFSGVVTYVDGASNRIIDKADTNVPKGKVANRRSAMITSRRTCVNVLLTFPVVIVVANFMGMRAFQLHQTKTLSGKACGPDQSLVCNLWHKCANCQKLLCSMNKQDEHRCGYSECPSCHETTDLNQHQCFV